MAHTKTHYHSSQLPGDIYLDMARSYPGLVLENTLIIRLINPLALTCDLSSSLSVQYLGVNVFWWNRRINLLTPGDVYIIRATPQP
jgi:hypothetical protein